MLRVVVESAKNLPKKKVGSPDPITTVIFKGKCPFTSSLFYRFTCPELQGNRCSLCFALIEEFQFMWFTVIIQHDVTVLEPMQEFICTVVLTFLVP